VDENELLLEKTAFIMFYSLKPPNRFHLIAAEFIAIKSKTSTSAVLIIASPAPLITTNTTTTNNNRTHSLQLTHNCKLLTLVYYK